MVTFIKKVANFATSTITIELLTCSPSFLGKGIKFYGVIITDVIISCDHDLLAAAPINGPTAMTFTGRLHVLHTETKENLNIYPVEVQGMR